MEAGKACDAFGLLPGHEIECADGESAYTQAKLGGPPAWVRLHAIGGSLNGRASIRTRLSSLC